MLNESDYTTSPSSSPQDKALGGAPDLAGALNHLIAADGFERGCECPGCNRHISRLEEFNAQLARECDRLHEELDQLRRDCGERKHAA